MSQIRKFDKGFRFLLCVIHIYCKYALVIPLKDKKELQLFGSKSQHFLNNAFQSCYDFFQVN